MADTLHNILPDVLITKQNLIDQGFKIDKKFVMVDSRAYTQEAFEYVLKLGDLAGSLIFVYDLKKIWANGRYFGGDVFQEDLNYWTSITGISEEGGITSTLAVAPKSNLIIKGKSHLDVNAIFDETSPNKNIVELNYNLEKAVNSNFVEIGGNRYNIVVENDKIKLNEYKPMKVTCSALPVLEYDSFPVSAPIQIKLTLSGSMPVKEDVSIEATNSLDLSVVWDVDTGILSCEVPVNTEVTFTFVYSDGITGGKTSVTQKWGYGVWLGVYDELNNGQIDIPLCDGEGNIQAIKNPEFFVDRFDYDKGKKILWVPGTSINTNVTINQNQNEYGLVIAPREIESKTLEFEFVDVSTNLTGGWTPMFDVPSNMYSSKIKYIPYRTDHRGLGSVTWKIQGNLKN